MSLSPEKVADLHVKHLEMLQAIITRLAGQSATLKNYTLTLTTAVCGFAISIGTPIVAMLALLPIIMFGILDAQYLRTERRVRRLYDNVRREDWGGTAHVRDRTFDHPRWFNLVGSRELVGRRLLSTDCDRRCRRRCSCETLPWQILFDEDPLIRPLRQIQIAKTLAGSARPAGAFAATRLANAMAARSSITPPPNPQTARRLSEILARAAQSARRNTFFSFHYEDIWRVNNVRNCSEFAKSSTDTGRKIEGFWDKSLWEKRKLSDPNSVKNMIRNGVKNTGAICVLVGTDTWSRPWVRYEIARAVIDTKGLLAVHINGIKHHKLGVSHFRGQNPLDYMGVGKLADGRLRLCELRYDNFLQLRWDLYDEHNDAVPLPKWLPEPAVGKVTALSSGTSIYDFAANDGHKNIGAWIDSAAKDAGR